MSEGLRHALLVDRDSDWIRKEMYSRLEDAGITLRYGWTNANVEKEFLALYDRTVKHE